MSDPPHLIDLFGGEGLAAYGFALAGWRVTSVENDPERIANHVRHPNITVVQADATTYPLGDADAVAGSPPCFDHTARKVLAERKRGRTTDTGWMLPYTIGRFREWAAAKPGRLWVVENVEGARHAMGLTGAHLVKLCGTMFDLRDGEWSLQRHRYFATNAAVLTPPCRHRGRKFIHIYGDLTANDRACGGLARPGGDVRAGVERARRLMGAPWASARGLALGLPVDYTRFLGEQLLMQLPDQSGQLSSVSAGPARPANCCTCLDSVHSDDGKTCTECEASVP